MNVHPYLHIDKSFKPCYVKKKSYFYIQADSSAA